MKCCWRKGWTRSGHAVGLVVLLAPVLFALFMPTISLGQRSGESGLAVPTTKPAMSTQSVAKDIRLPAPTAAPRPFVPFIAVFCSGLIISAARLARKFRLFWGLGVFTNPWAFLFILFGAVLCDFPVALQNLLPLIRDVNPWVGAASGILLAFALPQIPFKPKSSPANEGQVRGLEDGPRSNVIVAMVEDSIKDCILQRMQKEVVVCFGRYDWDTIKVAARRALEEEMTVRPLRQEKYEYFRKSIEGLQPDPDMRVDSNNKYLAFIGLLQWCSFYRLRDSLIVAAREFKS
jgi:hypothetical protein